MTETPQQKTLGMRWVSRPGDEKREAPLIPLSDVNTRRSLWPQRWPAIALQSCIDEVEAAPPEEQAEVKRQLPCASCVKNTACLNAKRKEIGSLMFDREYDTSPRSSESSLFPITLMRPMLSYSENFVPFWHKPFSLEHEWAIVQAWDIAWSEKVGGDYLVCMTAAVHRVSGRRQLLDIQRWRQKSFDDQIGLIIAKWQAFGADMVVIETDAAQQVWKQRVAKDSPVPVVGHTGADKRDLQVGVPGLLIEFENRKWTFPAAAGYHEEELQNFLSELEAFGWVDGHLQGVGEHDDTVMCFWHLTYGISKFLSTGQSREYHRGTTEGAEI